jgi:electron transport complex protein RnfG
MLSKLKFFWQQSWLLLASSFVFGLLLALTNAAWSPKIEANIKNKVDNRMKELIPQAASFEKVLDADILDQKGKPSSITIFKAISSDGKATGYSFIGSGAGFADKIQLIIAVDCDFKTIKGYSVLSSNETPGFGDRINDSYYKSQFVDCPAEKLKLSKTGDAKKIDSEIIALTGATITSQAVVNIFNNSLLQLKKQMLEKGLITNVK